MTLAEYSTAGDKDCFTYWLENRLEGSGSILGGSAFKFGVYSRLNNKPKESAKGRIFGKGYAWLEKFGNSPDEAFVTVRKQIIAIAEAARSGSLATIDDIGLSRAFKWKIAYHYQPAESPVIACIFQRASLVKATGRTSDDPNVPFSQLYRELARKKQGDETMLEFSARIWRDVKERSSYEVRLTNVAIKTGQLPITFRHAPFPDSMNGGATEADAGIRAKFRTDTGELFTSDISMHNSSSGVLRHSLLDYLTNIGAKADDSLYIVREAESAYVISRAATTVVASPAPSKQMPICVVKITPPLNQILYGPPGTGKTYHTIDKALEILDPAFYASNSQNRKALKKRYDELVAERVVQFVTFHQSFSYEDFVEGLRAETDEETKALSYEIADGVFKTLCASARTRVVKQEDVRFDPKAKRIWKLSLGNSYTEQHIFEECITNNYLLVGFGAGGDFSAASNRKEIESTYVASGGQLETNDYNITAINLFAHQMKVGDLVVVTEGNLKFRAIGEVTGEYEYLPRNGRDTYAQCRRVRWLRVYRPALPYDQLMDNRFSQMTMYELRDGSINLTKLRKLLEPNHETVGPAQPRVLIIDEINRGNVSRIFGELITLIEPSKRDGADEALKVTLPYSKEEFTVPSNVYLIGTMNTADRSLSGVDIALRRRFQFVEMAPQPRLLEERNIAGLNLGALLETINRRIEVLLDRDHQIGHAYFMSLRDNDSLGSLAAIFQYQVLPLLQEYFFEDWQRIAWVLNDHRKEPHCRFVDRSGVGIESLFGSAAAVPANGDAWFINHAAFGLAESYHGILSLG